MIIFFDHRKGSAPSLPRLPFTRDHFLQGAARQTVRLPAIAGTNLSLLSLAHLKSAIVRKLSALV